MWGLEKWGGGQIYFLLRRERGGFFQTLKLEGVIFFFASLANIFNKCHKKAIFHEKQLNLGYKIWAWRGLILIYMLTEGICFACMGGGSHQPNFLIPTSFKWPLPYQCSYWPAPLYFPPQRTYWLADISTLSQFCVVINSC